jgi:hypothetical protein
MPIGWPSIRSCVRLSAAELSTRKQFRLPKWGGSRPRHLPCPRTGKRSPMTSLQLKLIKIGARVIRHARAITFQLAEVAVTGPMMGTIIAAIHRLRAPPLCA